MLSLYLKDGEYLTIGDEIVVQVFANASVRLSVKAPKDMTILRGEVLERNGDEPPDCLLDSDPKKKKAKTPRRTGEHTPR